MKSRDICEYVKHYIEQDKTNSAILLTAPWGTGKSYYIKNELIPFLSENGTHKCILVSLYGLRSLFEVSKSIYIEGRLSVFNKKSESGTALISVVNTVFKGVTSFFGVDLSKSPDEMQKIYESIDLSDTLVILEDLERSGIEINEVLGYVNNLVEQDGVKVLLVANESELIKIEDGFKKEKAQNLPIKQESPEKQRKIEYTEETKRYLSTKEKTVSDTVLFENDYSESIKNIVSMFDNKYLDKFLNEELLADLVNFCKSNSINNLRTFIFACQKTNDILSRIELSDENDSDLIKTVFYSIIVFSAKHKKGERIFWRGNKTFSAELSSEEYPLFHFCYDYIFKHTFDIDEIDSAKDALNKLRLYDRKKSRNDKDLSVIYSWHLFSEEEVLNAVNSITNRLVNINDISFYEYGYLALYLVVLKHRLDCNISPAKELLIKNLEKKDTEIEAEYLFTTGLGSDIDKSIKDEYEELKSKMEESLSKKDDTIFDFDYLPEHISAFYDNSIKNDKEIYQYNAFAARLDVEKLANMLKNCSASEINEFRGAFLSVYRASNISQFLGGDKETLEEILKAVEELREYEGYDKIQKIQINWFAENLKNILSRF